MEASALRAGRVAGPRLIPLRGTVSDDRLVASVRAGREDAFEAIYDRYQRQLLSFCRHMLGSREEAEDVLQQTCLAAHGAILRSDKPIHLRAWLFTIARNNCLSVLRARREHASIEDVEPAVDGLAPAVQRREDLRDLLRDMARLPDDQRAALLLSELGDLSHDEIASILDCPKGKVKALVFQGRSSLISGREARDTPCAEIREQLATLSGGSLRRNSLRKHLRDCPGCREFQAQVKRQRADLALLLPVVPTAALKTGVLSGAAAKAGAAGATGAGAAGAGAAGVGAGAGGLGATLANVGVAKLLVAGAVAVGGVGGTVAAVHVASNDSSAKHSSSSSTQDGATGGASTGATTPSGVAPARALGEQAPGRQTGGVANGHNAKGDHGRSATSPGLSGTAPGRAGTSPGKAGTTPGRSKSSGGGTSRGKSGSAPGHTGAPRPESHGNSGGGGSGNRGGSSGSAPGQTDPGSSPGSASGQTGSRGTSGSAFVPSVDEVVSKVGAGAGKSK